MVLGLSAGLSEAQKCGERYIRLNHSKSKSRSRQSAAGYGLDTGW
jgi:hypothetical protein